jgi:hypothetical protein
MGYEGNMKWQFETKNKLENKTETVSTIANSVPKKDSLQIWYKPLKVDSLNLG